MNRVTRIKRPSPTLELYARAAAGSVLPDSLWGGGSEIPDEVLERVVVPDRADLAEYNTVCGFRTTDVLPVTYPHVLGFPMALQVMTGRSFPLPAIGMIHVRNAITVHQEVPADEAVTIRVYARGPYAHHRGAEVDLVTEAWHGEELLWEEASTNLSRGSTIAEDRPGAERSHGQFPVPTAKAYAREVRIAGDIGRRYASVSGDPNPIHLHALTARAFGFKRAIAHGMWMLANSLAVAGLPYQPPYRVTTAFRQPVFLPAHARLLTASDDGRLLVWLTGPTAETIHVSTVVERVPAEH
jgi:acyl dehydratase